MQMRTALSSLSTRRIIAKRNLYIRSLIPKRDFGNGAVDVYDEKTGITNSAEHYDVAIVGGGMVGLALACALSSMPFTKQLSVAIIDSNPALKLADHLKKEDTEHTKSNRIPDPRVSTVTPTTISFFKEVGAWEYVRRQRHAFFDQMQVWDYTDLGYTRYNAKDVGKDCLGCVVENKVLSSSLLSCLQDSNLQKTIYSARLTSMTIEPQISFEGASNRKTDSEGTVADVASLDQTVEKMHLGRLVKLDLSDGRSLSARLVIGADGAKSRVREISGLKTSGWNYSQSAIICTVEHAVENHCAWQRFLPSGPIALLPISDNFSNIVWTMTPESSSDHRLMSEDAFVKSVNDALIHGYGSNPQPSFLGRYLDKLPWAIQGTISTTEYFQAPPEVIKVVSDRLMFPLSLMHAHEYVSKRVALIGDAAHTVHPLAGQGVNLGFGDASALAKVISEGLSVGTDIGELSLLKKYEKERKAANITMMAILDGFQKAYSMDLGPVNLLRAAAFHGAQYIPPLKRSLISYAMGERKFPIFS